MGLWAAQLIRQVRYWAVAPEPGTSVHGEPEVAHCTANGLELVTDAGTTGITWVPYGSLGFGLGVADGPLTDQTGVARVRSVEGAKPSSTVLGQPITSARVHTVQRDHITAPAVLTLGFANRCRIWTVCGSWIEPDVPRYMTGDDINVLWRPESVPTLVPELHLELLAP